MGYALMTYVNTGAHTLRGGTKKVIAMIEKISVFQKKLAIRFSRAKTELRGYEMGNRLEMPNNQIAVFDGRATEAAAQMTISKSEGEIAARLDRLKIGRFHYRTFGLIGAGLFIDSFELQMAGAVLGALLANHWSTTQLNAWFISATFVGFLIGACFSGVLGDKYGRRFCYQINLAIFGLSSLAAALAPNMYVLIGLRLLMGIGLSGELVLGYATLSEFMPPAKRGNLVALLSFTTQCALFVAALSAYWVIPNLGWRWMFGIAGVAAVILCLIRKTMPESPRWLAYKGRFEEASAIVTHAEYECGIDETAPDRTNQQIESVEGKLSDLFRKTEVAKLVIGISIMITIQICLYGLISWLPSFFVQQGFSIGKSLQWNMIMTLGGPTGAFISLLLVDRIGRKPIIVTSAISASIFAVVYVCQSSEIGFMISGFLMIASIYGILVVGQAVYMPELFPTRLRMRGNGLCSAVARIVAAAIPFAIPVIFNAGGIRLVIGIVGCELVLFALVIAVLGRETFHKSLEESSVAV
ncbi:MFS transporter [Burkholderia sp. MR1-5-21]